MNALGKWLKQRRAALGLTQKELAQQIGCSAALLRKIEAGERRPSWQIAELLLYPLKIPEAEQAAFLQLARTNLAHPIPITSEEVTESFSPLSPLTPRENGILELIVQGLPDALIAERLALQTSTIRWYIKQIYSKCAVHRRDELIQQVIGAGLFERPQTLLLSDVSSDGDSLPTGFVAFMHGDIAGFTRGWQENPEMMRKALTHHDAFLPPLLKQYKGQLFNVSGDSFLVAFAKPMQALTTAATIQRQLLSQAWHPLPAHWLKLTLHCGPAELRNSNDYMPNETLMTLVRMSELTQGGQILLSQEMAELVHDRLPAAVQLEDLGKQSIAGLQPMIHLFQVTGWDALPVM